MICGVRCLRLQLAAPSGQVTIRRMSAIEDEYLARAQRLHHTALVVDSHSDTTQRLMQDGWDLTQHHDDGHVDVPRLRAGGFDAIFLAVFTPGPCEPGIGAAAARLQIQRIRQTAEQHPEHLMLACSADDVRQAATEDRIAILIAIEGGYLIEDSLDILREYSDAGATYLTLTHAFHTSWADSSGTHIDLEPKNNGLTAFGRDVVAELNRLGMMVDVSHVSDATFWDALQTSKAPIVATHSSCRAVAPHRRNLSDEMMRAIAGTGGVVQINFSPAFIDPDYPPLDPAAAAQRVTSGCVPKKSLPDHTTPLDVLVDHFDHALQTIGPEHVGIGADFDGIFAVPADMEDCSKLPNLTAALLRRGYTEADLTGMLGENILRVMDACEDVARSM